jgi:hypothetical protein
VHQQDVVDVGGEGLGAGRLAGGAAGERRAAGHDVGDALGIGRDDHPVADGDRFLDTRSIGAAGGGDTAAAAIDAGDAADEMVKRQVGGVRPEAFVRAEGRQGERRQRRAPLRRGWIHDGGRAPAPHR